MKYVLMFVDTEQFAADLGAMGEALRLAKSWPACPVVEIRPIAS